MAHSAQMWLGMPDDQRRNTFHSSSNFPWTQHSTALDSIHPIQQAFTYPLSYTHPLQCGNSWSEFQLYHHNPPDRYTSPSDNYSSNMSEISTTSDSIFTPPGFSQNLTHTSYPLECNISDVLGQVIKPNSECVSWESSGYSTPSSIQQQAIGPGILPTPYHLSISNEEMNFDHDDNADVDAEFEEDVSHFHPPLPQHSFQSEHFEFPGAAGITPASYEARSNDKKRVRRHATSEISQDHGDEKEGVDHESDSDYVVTSKRRKTSRTSNGRTTKSPGRKRRTSNVTPSAANASHKPKKSADLKEIVVSKHARQPSKTKGRKGPVFLQKIITPPIDKSGRSYPCVFHHFGCTAEFPNKNEWKRHVACQHLQLGFYRCDLGDCNPDNHAAVISPQGRRARQHSSTTADACNSDDNVKIYNDFNRKDLFTQHARRMHGPTRDPELCSNSRQPTHTKKSSSCIVTLHPSKEDIDRFEASLDEIRRRCWQVRRQAPARSTCGVCKRGFDADDISSSNDRNTGGTMSQGPPERRGVEEKAWEERMEHVGRHFELMNAKKEDEKLDQDLAEWGLATGVMRRLENGDAWLIDVEAPSEMMGEEGKSINAAHGSRRARRHSGRTTVVVSKFHDNSKVKAEFEHSEDEDA